MATRYWSTLDHRQSVLNILYNYSCQKWNKLLWLGSLEDLKVFVLIEIDEQTACETTWKSPHGGTLSFKSEHYHLHGTPTATLSILKESKQV